MLTTLAVIGILGLGLLVSYVAVFEHGYREGFKFLGVCAGIAAVLYIVAHT